MVTARALPVEVHGSQKGRHVLLSLLLCPELGTIIWRVTLRMAVLAFLVEEDGAHNLPARPVLHKVRSVLFLRFPGSFADCAEWHS